MVIKKLSEIANIQMGLVLSRKEAAIGSENYHSYMRLTLKSLDDSGVVNTEHAEPYQTNEELTDQIICKKDDVIIRIFTPLNPSIITQETAGLIIPSQLASIRIKSDLVLPKYVQFYLSQHKVLEKLSSEDTGTAQRSIKVGSLSKLEIPLPSIHDQKIICEIIALQKRREQLRRDLLEQEQLMMKSIINNLIYDIWRQ